MYIDLHTHTLNSDGALPAKALVEKALSAGIRIMAITDHNYTEDLSELRDAYPDMHQIQGAEISCLYTSENGSTTEIHVIGLGFDPNNEKMQSVLKRNQPDRRPYINKILARLKDECGIDVGTYEYLRAKNPTRHLGRMHIAKEMKERGYVSHVDAAFDEYIGGFGKRRAFVDNPLSFVSIDEAVQAIVEAGGYAVLCHLYYYKLEEAEYTRLIRHFKELSGDRGAMEVYYGRYDDAQRKHLRDLADEYELMYSAASDFHGQAEHETMDHHFTYQSCSKLLTCLGIPEHK